MVSSQIGDLIENGLSAEPVSDHIRASRRGLHKANGAAVVAALRPERPRFRPSRCHPPDAA